MPVGLDYEEYFIYDDIFVAEDRKRVAHGS